MRRRGERGQATVEFALIIPLVLVVVLMLVQVAAVAHAQLGVTHLSREIARAVAAEPSVDVGLLMHDRATLSTDHLVIEVFFETSGSLDRDFVVVTVSYQTPPVSRLFDPVSTQLAVSSRIKMLVES